MNSKNENKFSFGQTIKKMFSRPKQEDNLDDETFHSEARPEDQENHEPAIDPEQLLARKIDLLNIAPEQLEKIEGFHDLSLGQKYLALENLHQSILSRVKEESQADYQGSFRHVEKGAKVTKKISNFAHNFWQGIRKDYVLAKLEKAKVKEYEKSGFSQEVDQKMLQELVLGLRNYGPGAELNEHGQVELQFLTDIEASSAEEQELIRNFNQQANKFSKLPDEWRYETAAKKDRAKFSDTQWDYHHARNDVFNVLYNKLGDYKSAMLEMNKIESQIKMNQFLNTHPDVEERLKNIKDQTLFTKVLKSVATERGIYMAAGFAARTFTVGALGVLGAPLAAAGVGGVRAFNRAKKNLKDKEINSRRGEEIDKSEQAKNFVRADVSKEKIERLLEAIKTETDAEKIQVLLETLQTRIDYTEDKVRQGLMSFGGHKNRLANQYNLVDVLAEAKSTVLLGVERSKSEFREKVEARLERILDLRAEKISQKQKRYVVDQTLKGAALAAGFAFVGSKIRDLFFDNPGLAHQPNSSDLQAANVTETPSLQTTTVEATEPLNTTTSEAVVETTTNNASINPELTDSPALNNNSDLLKELSAQKMTVNTLEAGDGIGNYADVGPKTEVTFIDAEGNSEVHAASEVYVYPGDKVIQAEDGQIYVVRDSGPGFTLATDNGSQIEAEASEVNGQQNGNENVIVASDNSQAGDEETFVSPTGDDGEDEILSGSSNSNLASGENNLSAGENNLNEEVANEAGNSKEVVFDGHKLEFCDKYDVGQQEKITGFVKTQIEALEKEKELFKVYETKYGDRPEFVDFKQKFEADIANRTEQINSQIAAANNPDGQITIGATGDPKDLAEIRLKMLVEKSNLLTQAEKIAALDGEINVGDGDEITSGAENQSVGSNASEANSEINNSPNQDVIDDEDEIKAVSDNSNAVNSQTVSSAGANNVEAGLENNSGANNLPETFTQGKAVDQSLLENWEKLSVTDKEVYLQYNENLTSYNNCNYETAINNFLGQKPTEIINNDETPDIVVAKFASGHTCEFSKENGELLLKLDDGETRLANPENLIKARVVMEHDFHGAANNLEPETEIKISKTEEIFANVPEKQELEFISAYSGDEQVKILKYYDLRLEAMSETKKELAVWEEKYGQHAKFNEFADVLRSYLTIQSEKLNAIVASASDPSKTILKHLDFTNTPKQEVNDLFNKLDLNLKLRTYQERLDYPL